MTIVVERRPGRRPVREGRRAARRWIDFMVARFGLDEVEERGRRSKELFYL